MSTENALLTILVEKINNDALVLPTLPEVAVKVREAADDHETNLMQMAEVISQDPALTARIMKIANSAYLGRSIKVDTLHQAVTRIGLRQIKNIATALAMEQLFVSMNDIIKKKMDEVWLQTIEVAATAIALAQPYMKKDKHCGLNMDAMALASLVFNIGVLPILTEAERHQDIFANPTFIEGARKHLSGKIGGAILRAWGFPDEFIEVVEHWDNLAHHPSKVCYLDFVRVAALRQNILVDDNADNLYQGYIDRGVIESMEQFDEPDFKEAQKSVRSIFLE